MKADGFGVGVDSQAGWTREPQTSPQKSPPGPPVFREEGLSSVEADSLGQHCVALPGTQPSSAGGVMKSHQSHRAGPGS